MRLSNASHQETSFLPKKLLAAAPTISKIAKAKITPKPGIWKPISLSGCQSTGKICSVLSRLETIHSNTQSVTMRGTITNKPASSHLRIDFIILKRFQLLAGADAAGAATDLGAAGAGAGAGAGAAAGAGLVVAGLAAVAAGAASVLAVSAGLPTPLFAPSPLPRKSLTYQPAPLS